MWSILTGLFVIAVGVVTLWRWRVNNVTVPRHSKVVTILMILSGFVLLAVAMGCGPVSTLPPPTQQPNGNWLIQGQQLELCKWHPYEGIKASYQAHAWGEGECPRR